MDNVILYNKRGESGKLVGWQLTRILTNLSWQCHSSKTLSRLQQSKLIHSLLKSTENDFHDRSNPNVSELCSTAKLWVSCLNFCTADKRMAAFGLFFLLVSLPLSADCKVSLCSLAQIYINSSFPHSSMTPLALDGAYALCKRHTLHYSRYF